MTSNTTPPPYVIAASTETPGYEAFHVFDGNFGSHWKSYDPSELISGVGTLYMDFDVPYVVRQYTIQAPISDWLSMCPYNWALYGSNNPAFGWTLLDFQSFQSFAASEVKEYNFQNNVGYRYHQLYISQNQGGTGIAIQNLALYHTFGSQSPSVSISPSVSTSVSPSTAPGDIFYEGKLIETPEITKSAPDDYWGIEEPNDITVKLNNASGIFTTKMLAEEWRNKPVRFWSWDENKPEGSRRVFEIYGRITSFNDTDTLELTISPMLKEKLQADYPQRVYKVDDWTEQRPYIFNPDKDLGKPYALCFGRCQKVPLVYVHCDFINNLYDYIIGYGPIKEVTEVYRNQLKVPAEERQYYQFFDGTQTAPYPGFAFLRFCKFMKSNVSSELYDLSADVKGFTYGQANECRNFADNIRNLLSNTTWGLGEKVNKFSFDAASAYLDSIGDYYQDGYVSEQRPCRDILNDMLMVARARIRLNLIGEWEIIIDAPDNDIKQYFGSDDGKWENIKQEGITNYSTTPVENALKKITLKYKRSWFKFENAWKNDYASNYIRNVFDFGEEVEYENPFIMDHITADKFICYLQQRSIYRDKKLSIITGKEGKDLKETDLIHLTIPRRQIDSDFKIRSITKRMLECDLELISHSNNIYTYVPSTINTDPVPDDKISHSDFQYPDSPNYVKPMTPENFHVVEWKFIVGAGGAITARLLAQAYVNSKDDKVNFLKISFGKRTYDETNIHLYQWADGFFYAAGTVFVGPFSTSDEWRVNLDFPASTYPGGGEFEGGGGTLNYFDGAVKTVNIHNMESDWVLLPHEEIPFDPAVPVNITNLSQTLVGQNCFWTWDENTESRHKDYHIQVSDNPDFISPITNAFITDTSKFYLTSLSIGTLIYFRVRCRNTTLIESWDWKTISGTVGGTVNAGAGTIIRLPVCEEEWVKAGRFVNIFNGYLAGNMFINTTCIRHATASIIGREAHGFILEDGNPTDIMTVYLPGNVNDKAKRVDCVGGSVPDIGGYAYLSDDPDEYGTFSCTPPTIAGHIIQKLGLPVIEGEG
jgi:hypothetical protein